MNEKRLNEIRAKLVFLLDEIITNIFKDIGVVKLNQEAEHDLFKDFRLHIVKRIEKLENKTNEEPKKIEDKQNVLPFEEKEKTHYPKWVNVDYIRKKFLKGLSKNIITRFLKDIEHPSKPYRRGVKYLNKDLYLLYNKFYNKTNEHAPSKCFRNYTHEKYGNIKVRQDELPEYGRKEVNNVL